MANTSAPAGFRPVRYLSGAPYNGAVNHYHTATGDNVASFVGDPLTQSATASTYLGEIRPDVAQAATGGILVGVLVSVFPETNSALVYRAASTARRVAVAVDPDLMFEMEEGVTGAGAGTALAANDIGKNANFVVNTGSTVTGLSAVLLDNSTGATTATLDVKIVGFVNRPDNEIGSRAKWLVRINRHQFSNQIIGLS